jgi:Protein of unknown function (DUF2855)
MSLANGIDFLVKRDDLRQTQTVEAEAPRPPGEGEVTLHVEKFGLTANNITYAVYGETMRYWDFFPGPDGWAGVPVWGFGEVIDSGVDGISRGERFYGYYPTSTYATFRVQPNSSGFIEISESRQPLAGAYNRYLRTTDDAAYDPAHENEQMIMRPLFMTSFLLADYLVEDRFFGAKSVLISSASSKTALSLAFLVSRQAGETEIVGLTSPTSRGFTESTGYYDKVMTYQEVASLPRGEAVYVDISGSSSARAAVHKHFGDLLRHSVVVGDTHWEEEKRQDALPGPPPTFFFAPNHMSKRQADWGEGGLHQHFAEAWAAFRETLGWMDVVEDQGPDALRSVYLELLEGRTNPRSAHVLSLPARD